MNARCTNVASLLVAFWSVALSKGFVVVVRNTNNNQWPLERTIASGNHHDLQNSRTNLPIRRQQLWAKDDDDDEEDPDIDLSDKDWRAFRAQLVMGESGKEGSKEDESETAADTKADAETTDLDGIGSVFATDETTTSSTKGMTPLDPSQWAYDSGTVIEQGAVILGGVEQDFSFGLRQQYFHKAAILVLDHEPATFTKGIILNRPTDLVIEDSINNGLKWNVWYGGDVQGWTSDNPDYVCLHSLSDPKVKEASRTVMNEIQWTTFENAQKLVKNGNAKSTDFWVFCGYAGWGPNQLMGELDRKSWYMVATDSQTLLKDLARQSKGVDPRDAGLETWTLLMNMIGRKETAEEYSGSSNFDDLMLKEWARQHLLPQNGDADSACIEPPSSTSGSIGRVTQVESIDDAIERASRSVYSQEITEGTIVRGSSAERSPFLLNNQELHKSLILIINDVSNMSVGVILNRPSPKVIEFEITDKKTGESRQVKLPLRFGGQFMVQGREMLLWFHCSPACRDADIGQPLGPQKNGIWQCSLDDVTEAISKGLAKPDEFMVVSGVSVWTKNEEGMLSGIQGEVQAGRFEVVPPSKTESIWSKLIPQQVLTAPSMLQSLAVSDDAWQQGALNGKAGPIKPQPTNPPPEDLNGRLEDVDEEGYALVFKSDTQVVELGDLALKSWVATFLLNAPSLGSS